MSNEWLSPEWFSVWAVRIRTSILFYFIDECTHWFCDFWLLLLFFIVRVVIELHSASPGLNLILVLIKLLHSLLLSITWRGMNEGCGAVLRLQLLWSFIKIKHLRASYPASGITCSRSFILSPQATCSRKEVCWIVFSMVDGVWSIAV